MDITTIDIIGPFLPEHRVLFNGYALPYVTATPHPDGRVDIFIDRRFGLAEPVSKEEFDRWIPILANAMAVAAGYSSFGEHSGPVNPFQNRTSRLGRIQPDLTVVNGGKPEPQRS